MASQELQLGGLHNSQSESKTPLGRAWASQNATVLNGVLEGGPRYLLFGRRSSYNAGDVCYGMSPWCRFTNNETQKLAVTGGTPTSGSVTLSWNNGTSTVTTAALANNSTAQDVEAALLAFSTIRSGEVSCTGGPWPSNPIYVEFRGRYAASDVAAITLASNTMNNSATVTISEFIKGGAKTLKLIAIKHNGSSTVNMYTVDSSGTFTSVASGLAASNWEFVQYGNQIFAANAGDGLHYFRMGGSWDDTGGSTRPNAPSFPLSFAYGSARPALDFTATGVNATATVTGITATVTKTVQNVQIKNTGADVNDDTTVTLTLDMASAQDWSFRDPFEAIIQALTDNNNVVFVPNSLVIQVINNDGSPVTMSAQSIAYAPGSSYTSLKGYFSFAGKTRADRDNIKKIVVTFTVSKWLLNKSASLTLTLGDSCMHDYIPTVPDTFKRDRAEYAYSYVNTTTGVESNLSEPFQTLEFGALLGTYAQVIARGTSQLGVSDRVWFYRKEKSTSLWRRLPSDATNLGTFGAVNDPNAGPVVFVDRWMESELRAFPTPTGINFPGANLSSGAMVLGVFKGSLAIGFARRLWFSEVSVPGVFAPDPEDKEATRAFVAREQTNTERARTVFVSDNRSEEVYGIIGQDTAYPITQTLSAYAMVGDSPADSTLPRRLPGSRGAISTRGNQRYLGGAHVMAKDGLFYYAVGRGFSGEDNGALAEREETLEVRRSYQTTLAPSGTGVAAEYESEIWLFDGAKYLWRDRNGSWMEGTWSASVVAADGDRTLGLMFADSTGQIMKVSPAYTTDNGTAATFSYETGVMDGPRVRVTGVEIHAKGTPRITIRVYRYDGDKSDDFGRYKELHVDTPSERTVNRKPVTLEPGYKHKFLISGTVGRDRIESLSFTFDERGKAFGE